MEYSLCIGIIFGCIVKTQGQIISYGCPVDWVIYQTNCYKFVDTKPLVYEEADTACWSDGATLLSVNDNAEHNFVSDWLLSNTVMRQSEWLTSGYYASGTLLWEGSNRGVDEAQAFWVQIPLYDETFKRVAYSYRVIDYGWKVVSASIPANYICEIPRTRAANIDILDRGFDYGIGSFDPKTLQRGPIMKEEPDSFVILDGASSIDIYCAAIGNPYATYTWFKGNDFRDNATQVTSVQNSRYTLSSGRLSIQDPGAEDIGSFHCKATNEIGSSLSIKAHLIYGYLGKFSNIDPEPAYATAFKGTMVHCNSPAHATGVGYEWFKSWALFSFIYPGNENIFVSHSGALYFSEVQPTDAEKRYYCVVSLVSEDFKMSTPIGPSTVNLGVLLRLSDATATDNNYGPIINTHAFPSPALRGRTIRLECIAYGTHPLTYTWRRKDGRAFVPGTKLSHLNRVLTIPNAPIQAGGTYICKCARGKIGVVAEEPVTVVIETKPYFPFPIKDMLVDPGMTFEWFCRAVARPRATYTWYKNGNLLSTIAGQLEINGNVLKILKGDKSRDEGMYQCAATNQHGTTFSTGQLKILSFAPNFDKRSMPALTLAPVGGSITIPCSVEAAPVPQVRWLKNGVDLNLFAGETNGRIGMTTRFDLVMREIQYSDQGAYTCLATNANGKAQNTTFIQIIQGITLLNAPSPTSVAINNTAFLYCQASYDSSVFDLAYIWKHNGRIIDYKFSPEYVIGRRQGINGLYITNAQYKHTGDYECKAMTTLHSVSGTASVRVQGQPGPPAGVFVDDETITSHSARIVWTVGEDIHHGSPILSYDVEGETNFKPGIWNVIASDIPELLALKKATDTGKRPDQRAYNLIDLVPNTSYNFRVRAVNTFGRGQEASRPSAAVRIAASEPIQPVINVGGGGGTVGTLTIAWEPLDVSEHCGPGLAYYVYWKRVGDTRDWIKNVASDHFALNEGKFVATVGEENFYLQYQVMVGVFNSIGHGPNSTVKTIYSAEGMPVSVPILGEIDTVNGTSLTIYWEPVPNDRENMKGIVAGYRVFYYADEYGVMPFDNEPDPVLNRILFKDVYGQTDHVQLVGLKPYYQYFARALVFNTAGMGPKGEWRVGETANMPLRQFPTHLKVIPRDRHSIHVQWRGISISGFDEETLTGYIIRVWKVQDDIRTAMDTQVDKVMDAVIGGLQAYTVYELRVLGFSRAGDGALSEAVFFTVLGGSVQVDPTTSEICYASETSRTCDGTSFRINEILLIVTLTLKGLMTFIDI